MSSLASATPRSSNRGQRSRQRSKIKSAGEISIGNLSALPTQKDNVNAGHRRFSSVRTVMGIKTKKSLDAPQEFKKSNSFSPLPYLQEVQSETPWFLSPELKQGLLKDLKSVVKHQVGCPIGTKKELADLDLELLNHVHSVLAMPSAVTSSQKTMYHLEKWGKYHQKLIVSIINGRRLWCGKEKHDARLACKCQVQVQLELVVTTPCSNQPDSSESECAITKLASNSQTEWNSRHELSIGKVQDLSLSVKLLQKNSNLIGSARIPLKDILVSRYESWIELKTERDSSVDSSGEIKLCINYALEKMPKVHSCKIAEDVFELAAQTFIFQDFKFVSKSHSQARNSVSAKEGRPNKLTEFCWDGELQDLSMYLLLQMQHQYNLSECCVNVRCLSAAISILIKMLSEYRDFHNPALPQARKQKRSLRNAQSCSNTPTPSEVRSFISCVERYADKICDNAVLDDSEMSLLNKCVKACSDMALDLISSNRSIFPPTESSSSSEFRLILDLLSLLSKLYGLPSDGGKARSLKGLQEDIVSSLLASAKHWSSQFNLNPLSSLAKEVIDYSQLLAVLKELATFVRKVDGILKCNMKDLDDLFSKVGVCYSDQVCQSMFSQLLPELEIVEQITETVSGQLADASTVEQNRDFLKELQSFMMTLSNLNECASKFVRQSTSESCRSTFIRTQVSIQNLITPLLPLFYHVWEHETKELVRRTLCLEMEWYGTQTLRSLLSLDEEGIDLQSALALRNHLEAVWIAHNMLLTGITAKDIILYDGMLVTVYLNCIEYYLAELTDYCPTDRSSLHTGAGADINPVPLMVLNNWSIAQSIIKDLSRSLSEQFRNIFINESTSDGVSPKSLFTFGQESLKDFHESLLLQFECYQEGETNLVATVSTVILQPFITQLMHCDLAEHGYETLQGAMFSLKVLFQSFEKVVQLDTTSKLVAAMFSRLVGAIKKQVLSRPFVKPAFYRRLLWQLSSKENKETSLEQLFASHTKEDLQELAAFKDLQRFLGISGVPTPELISRFWEREAASVPLPDYVTTSFPIVIKTSYKRVDFVQMDISCHFPATLHNRNTGPGSVLDRLLDFSPMPHDQGEVLMEQFYVPFLNTKDSTYSCEAKLHSWDQGVDGSPSTLSLCFTQQGIAAAGACILFRLYDRRKRRFHSSEEYYGRALLPLASFYNKERRSAFTSLDLVFTLQEVSGGEEIFFALKHRADVIKGAGLVFYTTEEKFRNLGLHAQQRLMKTRPAR
ncbi:uncharacterized protein LOC135808876 [Sycon ciliatum]|uniref:uncharacterized protein LOC135808876 n=1 Tax=Sycon ciliatum TaxID=27933 RepID=UPI0031F67CE0